MVKLLYVGELAVYLYICKLIFISMNIIAQQNQDMKKGQCLS
jgi:hypothetical protein